ncbi:hypothetical protein BDV18DRAFT_130481 [Aspergillus unguis]
MANQVPVHLFDLHSTLPIPSKAWSPNTLKTRLALNYKGIPYTQTYVSYPDIAPLLKSLSVPPNPEGTASTASWTLPAIQHSGGAIMGSLPIARYLEKQFPERPLFPSGNVSYAIAVAVDRIMSLVGFALYELIVPRIKDILDPRAQEYYERTRSAMFGKPVADVRPTDEREIQQMIDKAKKEMMTIVEMLKGNSAKAGPFLEGEQPSYADFIVIAYLTWYKTADGNIWKQLIELGDGELRTLWDAVSPWVAGQGEDKEWDIPQ